MKFKYFMIGVALAVIHQFSQAITVVAAHPVVVAHPVVSAHPVVTSHPTVAAHPTVAHVSVAKPVVAPHEIVMPAPSLNTSQKAPSIVMPPPVLKTSEKNPKAVTSSNKDTTHPVITASSHVATASDKCADKEKAKNLKECKK